MLGTLLSMKHELRKMQPQGSGSIVNISSTMGSRGAANMSLYAGSKHAVEGITKSASIEAAPFGVRVNAVAPGPTETGMLDRLTGSPDMKAPFYAAVPMKRGGTPEEIAEAIVFVASARASFITGQIIGVNGGQDRELTSLSSFSTKRGRARVCDPRLRGNASETPTQKEPHHDNALGQNRSRHRRLARHGPLDRDRARQGRRAGSRRTTGNSAAEAEEVVRLIRAAGGRADAVGADLTAPDAPHKLAAEVRRIVGSRLDILVANAGVAASATIEETTVEDFDRLFAVNVPRTLLPRAATAADPRQRQQRRPAFPRSQRTPRSARFRPMRQPKAPWTPW